MNLLKDNCSSYEISNKENQKLKNENFNLKLQIAALNAEVNELQSTVNLLKSHQFTYDNMKKDSDSFKHHTGLIPEQFNTLLDFVSPGSKAENVKYYEAASV